MARLNYISEICSTKFGWNLKVRVVRLWYIKDHDKSTAPKSIELLMEDERGDRIHATLGSYVHNKFRNEKREIKEMGLYKMSNFAVGPNNRHFKTNRHKFTLAFTIRTTVEETVDANFGFNIFRFRPFDDLINQIDVDENELFDVIGQLVCHGEVQSHQLQSGKISQFMNVVLEDTERNSISATFWGEFVDQILPHLGNLSDQPIIVVMQLIRAHKFQGVYSVKNTWGASKLWISPDLPQVDDFKSKLGSASQTITERISQPNSQRSLSVSEELAAGSIQLKSIEELVNCNQEGQFWIVATIVDLELEKGWSYLGCKMCTKKVYPVANKFYCKKCKTEENSVSHRYRLQIKVVDRDWSISLLLFDREATKLIGKNAKELKECSVEISGSAHESCYPVEMDALLDRTAMFRVIVKQENIESNDQMYVVAKISDDEDLIKQYNKSGETDECTDCMAENEMMTPKKLHAKRGRPKNGGSIVEVVDDDAQLSSNKSKKLIKKEKNP